MEKVIKTIELLLKFFSFVHYKIIKKIIFFLKQNYVFYFFYFLIVLF